MGFNVAGKRPLHTGAASRTRHSKGNGSRWYGSAWDGIYRGNGRQTPSLTHRRARRPSTTSPAVQMKLKGPLIPSRAQFPYSGVDHERLGRATLNARSDDRLDRVQSFRSLDQTAEEDEIRNTAGSGARTSASASRQSAVAEPEGASRASNS